MALDITDESIGKNVLEVVTDFNAHLLTEWVDENEQAAGLAGRNTEVGKKLDRGSVDIFAWAGEGDEFPVNVKVGQQGAVVGDDALPRRFVEQFRLIIDKRAIIGTAA